MSTPRGVRSIDARALLATLASCVALVTAADARAGDPPTATASGYSGLETRLIERTLAARGFVLEPSPEGLVLEGVAYQALEVFDDDDPVPDELNVFHTRTKEWILAREVLLGVGDPWSQPLVDETARNIRALTQISLTLAVPIKGTEPGKVRLLLIVRDIWSLRPDWNIQFLGGRLNYLSLQPTESNLGGIHHEPQLAIVYQPLSLQTGAAYTIPRIGLSHLAVSGAAGVYLPLGARTSPDGQSPEGSYASLSVSQPLFSSRAPWSWSLSGAFLDFIDRKYENGRLKQFPATDPLATTGAPGSVTAVPWQWRDKRATVTASATRSFGWALKNDFTLGFTGRLRRFTPEGDEGIAQPAVDQFVQQRVPRGENRVYPFARWRSYGNNFFRTIEVESLGTQEDFRLGHDLFVEIDPISRALGSTRSLVSVSAGASWTSRIGDGLIRGSLEGFVETQTDGRITDAIVDGKLGIVTPRTGFGRLIFSGRYIHRPENYLNKFDYLGGDTRLRGYPSQYLSGSEVVALNLELRTPGLYKWGMAMGGVVFYDSGDAFTDMSKFRMKHSVGVGLRFLLPFFDDIAYRFDFAVPLDRDALPANTRWFDGFIIAIEQAFPFPKLCATSSTAQAAVQCPK